MGLQKYLLLCKHVDDDNSWDLKKQALAKTHGEFTVNLNMNNSVTN